MPAHKLLSLAVLLLSILPAAVVGKSCEGHDLPPDGQIRVGVKLKKDCNNLNRAKKGQWARIFYTESFYANCSLITKVGEPDGYVFQIGATNGGLKAFHEGVVGMCEGEKRKITAPANLAYGGMAKYMLTENSDLWIPPNATIMYEIEMMMLTAQEEYPPDYMKKMFDNSAKSLITSEDHIGHAAGVENSFPSLVKTAELSPEWAHSKGVDYFQAKYDERKMFFDVAKNNRKKKGMEYEDSDPWLDKMLLLIEELKTGKKGEL
ncbi:hypothetical protein TrST_g9893 [Triparma strigata]|uniref:peptidylprolyl isomerase n=1 Tax=Triparma strigata TaxID=1606541 RepID=A0A9W7E598_9STRA|nr:hypothetical protein TrST_g9893 [Triparma strigata]